LALSSPGPAEAASVYDVIRDCQDGVVDGRYSLKELRRAERSLPSDQSEYSDCQDALHEAQVSARERRAARPGAEGGEADGGDGGGGSGGGGQGGAGTGGASGSPPPLPEDVAALDEEVGRAAVDGPPQVSIGGRPLTPLASGPATARSAAGVISRLPAPMLLAMLGISALCLAAVALTARDRLPGARRLALRLRRR
jgi:hypothetical protein